MTENGTPLATAPGGRDSMQSNLAANRIMGDAADAVSWEGIPPYALAILDLPYPMERSNNKFKRWFNSPPNFEDWLNRVMVNLWNGGKEGSYQAWFANERFAEWLKPVIRNSRFDYRSTWVWNKNPEKHSMGLGSYGRRDHEFVIISTKGKPSLKPSKQSTILSFQSPNTRLSSVFPSQKPVELYKQIIISLTHENDVIVDPSYGSGTIFNATNDTNRVGFGIDIDESSQSSSLSSDSSSDSSEIHHDECYRFAKS